MGCSSSTDGGTLPARGRAPPPAVQEDGTAPKAESYLRRMFVRNVITIPKTTPDRKPKKGLRRLRKNKVAPMPIATPEKVPSKTEVVGVVKLTATEMVHELRIAQAKPTKELVKAGLSVSSEVKPNKFGVHYELADFERPPSRSYGRPGSRLAAAAAAPRERMSLIDRHQRQQELAAILIDKDAKRKKHLEDRLAHAHRSVERVEKVRERKVNALLENASLTITDLVKKEQGKKAAQAWTLEEAHPEDHPRPPTPFRPPSRSRSRHEELFLSCKDPEAAKRTLRREAMIKQKQAEMNRQQAQEAKLTSVRLLQARSKESRDRRRLQQEQKRAALNRSCERTARAADRHQENLESVKERAERDLKRVRYLKCQREINKVLGVPSCRSLPVDTPAEVKELHAGSEWWDDDDDGGDC